jgi:hypothetical protein
MNVETKIERDIGMEERTRTVARIYRYFHIQVPESSETEQTSEDLDR